MKEQIQSIAKIAVLQGLESAQPPITRARIIQAVEEDKIDAIVATMFDATRSVVDWGSQCLGFKLSDDELTAIALHAMLDAFNELFEFEGALGLVRSGLAHWLTLDEYSDESIREALEEAAREMGLDTRIAKDIAVVDEAQEMIGRYIEF